MGGLFQLFLGKGRDFQDMGHRPLLGLLTMPWNCHATSGCVISLAVEEPGLVLFPSWSRLILISFMMCSWAMSFFPKLCPAPFLLVTTLPWEFLGQRSLAGYNPKGHKEVDKTEWLSTSLKHYDFSKQKASNSVNISLSKISFNGVQVLTGNTHRLTRRGNFLCKLCFPPNKSKIFKFSKEPQIIKWRAVYHWRPKP